MRIVPFACAVLSVTGCAFTACVAGSVPLDGTADASSEGADGANEAANNVDDAADASRLSLDALVADVDSADDRSDDVADVEAAAPETAARMYFEQHVYPSVQPTCEQSCHGPGRTGVGPEFFGADAHASYLSFISFGYQNGGANSPFITKPQHEGPALTSGQITIFEQWEALENPNDAGDAGMDATPPQQCTSPTNFQNMVAAEFTGGGSSAPLKCTNCHSGAGNGVAALDLSGLVGAAPDYGAACAAVLSKIDKADPAASLIITKPAGATAHVGGKVQDPTSWTNDFTGFIDGNMIF